MIPRHQVAAEITDALNEALDHPVYLGAAPSGATSAYAVVSVPPGSGTVGGVGEPEQSTALRIDIRAVALASTTALAAREALRVSDVTTVAALGLALIGDAWSLAGRHLVADSGIIDDANAAGAAANVVTTIEYHVGAIVTP